MTAPIVHPRLAEATFGNAVEPLLRSADVFERADIKLLSYKFPFLDVELTWHRFGVPLRLRVDGSNYNYRPVRGWWIDEAGEMLLSGLQLVPVNAGFHTSRLDGSSGCWFCFLGWQDYHDHGSHQDTAWALIRADPKYSVTALIQRLQVEINGDQVQRA